MYDYLKSKNFKVEDELFRLVQGGDNFEIREEGFRKIICIELFVK